MSEQIKVGDLVMIVKATPCCGRYEPTRAIFVVSGIESFTSGCRFCHRRRTTTAASIEDVGYWIDVNRLKRIPPLSELEGEKRDEPMKKPA